VLYEAIARDGATSLADPNLDIEVGHFGLHVSKTCAKRVRGAAAFGSPGFIEEDADRDAARGCRDEFFLKSEACGLVAREVFRRGVEVLSRGYGSDETECVVQ